MAESTPADAPVATAAPATTAAKADTATTAAAAAPAPAPAQTTSAVASESAGPAAPPAAAPAAGVTPQPVAAATAPPAGPTAAPTATAARTGPSAPSPETQEQQKEEDLWQTPNWPLESGHALRSFHTQLPKILESAGHGKIWGVELSPATPAPFPTLIVLQKFLRSTAGDLDLAAQNLTATLKWRKDFGLDTDRTDDIKGEQDFQGLGYITVVPEGGARQIVTWNVYGAVKNIAATFGDLPRFLRWRVDLMERSMARLALADAKENPIPDLPATEDPYRLLQVHVYSDLSFLRLPPEVKAASKATIDIMAKHYPETLSRKFFVGVPRIMGWVFSFVRMFVSRETSKKFNVIAWEEQLAPELGDKEFVPQRFGGSGSDLKELEVQTVDM